MGGAVVGGGCFLSELPTTLDAGEELESTAADISSSEFRRPHL
jgi:hypothetical protein